MAASCAVKSAEGADAMRSRTRMTTPSERVSGTNGTATTRRGGDDEAGAPLHRHRCCSEQLRVYDMMTQVIRLDNS